MINHHPLLTIGKKYLLRSAYSPYVSVKVPRGLRKHYYPKFEDSSFIKRIDLPRFVVLLGCEPHEFRVMIAKGDIGWISGVEFVDQENGLVYKPHTSLTRFYTWEKK